MRIQSLDGDWQVSKAGANEWIHATVPGSIHVDLMAAGVIPDPLTGDNEVRLGWIAETDWVYRRTFDLDDLLKCERILLECDGLDTIATIRLNGEEIGHAQNMHRRYEFDLTGRCLPGSNSIEIEFQSPVQYAFQQLGVEELVITPSDSIPGSPYVRKAMYQWGWDWAPKLPTSGIWRPIRLAGYSSARLGDIRIRQSHSPGHAEIHVEADIERFNNAGLTVRARLISPAETSIEKSSDIGTDDNRAQFDIGVDNPSLWWPNGYGAQPLYTLEIEILSPDGRPVDGHSMRIGLRALELRQEDDGWGRSFVFVVNGVPIFCKGANWIPADQFPARITDDQYRDLIRSCADTHMNMLRIWGGGIYESDIFYDLCDEYGILIWQDFMFAGAHYPMGMDFLKNVKMEAVDNIRRIRHHPCLALWCGNNEMEWFLARGWTGEGDEERKKEYCELFCDLLKDIAVREDPNTHYWTSSPASGVPFEAPNGENEGDGHYWEVWHGRALFTAYRKHFFRFMSEFGFQSLPSVNTVASFAEPKDWNIVSYIMEAHQKSYIGNGQIIYDMIQVFRLPETFPMLVYVGQVLQAEAIRYGVEHWRRNRNGNRCMGTLYWQLNDCWPVASWSSIEYNHHWKALHYYARRFYAPVLLSAEESGGSANLHVTNDLLEEFRGEIHWSLESLDGTVIESGRAPVIAPSESNTFVVRLDFSNSLNDDNKRSSILVYELYQDDRRISLNAVSFVPTKHMELPQAHISAEVWEEDGKAHISLNSDSTARFVMLEIPGHDVRFDDNYFDLPTRRSVIVTVADAYGLSADQIREKLTITSLRDSYLIPQRS